MGARPIILPKRRGLAFPAGWTAGFDPTHVAAGTCRFSGIANEANFVNLLSGTPGTFPGAPTPIIDGSIGPSITSSGGSVSINFSGQTTVNDSQYTFGAIFRAGSPGNTSFISNNNSANSANGTEFAAASGTQLLLQSGGNFATFATLVAPNAYFAAASLNSSKYNWVLLNLSNGKFQTGTGSGFSTTAPNGTYNMGGGTRGSHLSGDTLSAVMFSATFLSIPQLVLWAADPWSFWYPNDPLAQAWPGITTAPVVSGLPHGLHFHATMGALKAF